MSIKKKEIEKQIEEISQRMKVQLSQSSQSIVGSSYNIGVMREQVALSMQNIVNAEMGKQFGVSYYESYQYGPNPEYQAMLDEEEEAVKGIIEWQNEPRKSNPEFTLRSRRSQRRLLR